MKAPLSRIPALPAAAGLVAGIVASQIGWALACIVVAIPLFIILYFYGKHYFSFYFVMALAGAALAYARTPANLPQGTSGHPVEIFGEVRSVTARSNTDKYVVAVDSANSHAVTPFKCVFYSSGYYPGIGPGAQVRFKARLNPVEEKTGIPYEIDYAKYLKYDGLSATAYLDSDVEVVRRPRGMSLLVNNVRDAMYNGIVDSPIDGATASFLLAVILGDDSFISNDTQETFRATGLSHMLALSGLHVGLIAAMIGFVLFPANITRRGFLVKPIVVIVLIWLYAMVTGMGASVTRASAMITAFMLARIIQRDSNPINSLCLAAVIVLIINPYSLFTPGFQMSFAAVISILLFTPLLPDRLRRRPILWFFLSAIVISVSAMLGTGIIAAYYFHAFPLSFLVANLAVGIIFPWLLGIGILLMLLTMCGIHAVWLGWIANALNWALSASASGVHAWGPGQISQLFFSAWSLVPYALFLVFLALAMRRTLHRDDMQRGALVMPWVMCAAALVVFLGFAYLLRPAVPTAELYIASGTQPSLIVRHGTTAYALPLSQYVNKDNFLQTYNQRYASYLQSRGCSEFALMPYDFEGGPFYKRGSLLVAGDKLLCLATSDEVKAPSRKADYLLVSAGYTKSASALIERVPADSVLICPGTNGQRANRILRDCAGQVPCRKCTSLSLTW